MIRVYWSHINQVDKINTEEFLYQLSDRAKSKYRGFKRHEDQALFLLAMVLLDQILTENGYDEYSLRNIEYTRYGRPFFRNSKFDFNISHTTPYVAIVFSEENQVGIDIEKIRTIDLKDYKTIFSTNIWNQINSSANNTHAFFNYWTQLESALKADGRGFSILSESTIQQLDHQVIIDDQKWVTNQICLTPAIACCVASDAKSTIRFTKEVLFT